MPRLLILSIRVLTLGSALALSNLAAAQTPSTAAPAGTAQPAASGASEQDVRSLIRTLKDDASRQRLIEDLETLIAAQKADEAEPADLGLHLVELPEGLLSTLAERANSLGSELIAGASALGRLPEAGRWIAAEISDPARQAWWLDLLWKIVAVLAAAAAAEWLATRLLRRPRSAVEAQEADAYWIRAVYLIARTVLDLVPIAAFAAAAYGLLPLLHTGARPGRIILAVVTANVVSRGVRAVSAMVLAPRVSGLRIVPVGDDTANYLYIWARRFTVIAVYGFYLAQIMILLRVAPQIESAFERTVGLLLALMAVVLVLQSRKQVCDWLQRSGPAGAVGVLRNRLGDVWHVLAIIYIAAMYGVWALNIKDGFEFVIGATALSAAILIAANVIVAGAKRALERVFAVNDEIKTRFPGIDTRANRYFAVLIYTITTIVYVMAAFFVLRAWSIDAFAWFATPFGARLVGAFVTTALLSTASVVLWEMVNSAVERRLSATDENGGTTVTNRARTLLPLFRSALFIVLATLVTMVFLSELGVNIGPLLAGAGVVGLAVGFGAQTLVKDIITGVFILMEDQISVGDVVTAGGHSGLVEALTIRTIRLRDLSGNVHVVPFSEVTTVENMTKDFSRYVFNVGVAYREDTDEVCKVLTEIGAEMMEDTAYQALILEPLEILGVDQFADSAVVIKARITTRPIKQWQVGREFNRRMKKRFDELGIEIPFPHQTIYFGEDKSGGAPPARVRLAQGDDTPPRSASPDGAPPAPVPPSASPNPSAGQAD